MSSSMGGASVGTAAASLMSAHRDVLEAPIPETPEGRAALVDELKNRARGAVSAKAYKDAELLYHKAIEIDDHNAILYGNLSLVQMNMGFFEASRQAAEKAVEIDPSYVKGHWRLGQALQKLSRNAEALEAFQAALERDPSNKALQKECEKLEKNLEEEKALMEMDIDKANLAEPTASSSPARTTTTVTPPKPSSSKATSTAKIDDDDEDEKVFSKSDHVKGYKVVNGKKTTYFHTELSEDAKQLIGDIAPKRIDEASAQPQQQETAEAKGTSAWNKAGTWEERDVSAWAKETLMEKLLATTYVLPDSSPVAGAVATISSVPTLDGHASFATVRGKKRYIYEFCVTVAWQLEGLRDNETAKGKMTFPDVDGTCELGEGYDMVHWEVHHDTPASLRPLLDRFVQSGGLRDALHETLDNWVRLFRATY